MWTGRAVVRPGWAVFHGTAGDHVRHRHHAVQVALAAGAVLDLSLYSMHRWSHVNHFLWRLHAIHHSPERLYWLNSERRHPLSALVLAGPGFLALLLLGATAEAVSAWFAILTIHLAFQHSNLDYRVGPLKWLLGVAEVHRWHHKREIRGCAGQLRRVLDDLGSPVRLFPSGCDSAACG